MVFFIDSLAKRLIYHPEPPDSSLDHPPISKSEVEEVWVSGSENSVHAWFYHHPDAKHSLLFCHGNAGHLAHRHEAAELLRRRLHGHVLLFDYRGYGRSRGVPDEAGICQDAENALNKLRELSPQSQVMLFGRSLGAAVAIELAQRCPDIHALLLASPFTSIAAMCRQLIGSQFPARYLSEQFDSITKIQSIQTPTFVFHGEQDSLIPIEQGKALFDASASVKKEWLAIPKADHNDLLSIGGEELLDRLQQFVESLS